MLDWLEFVISEAFVSLKRNSLITFAAIVTVGISLFLIGGFGYIYFRAESFAQTLPNEFQMRVFLKDSVQHKEIVRLSDNLRDEPGVSEVQFMPKTTAWIAYRRAHPEIPADIPNSLPNGFNVVFRKLKYATVAVHSIKKWPQVDKVVYQPEVLKTLQQGIGLMRYVGFLGLILFLISGILVFNAIRFTIIARKTEIRIMQLIGATQATLRTPFIIEGIVQGTIGGIFATIFLVLMNSGVARFAGNLGLIVPQFPTRLALEWLIVLGAILGATCSSIAIKIPLKYR